MCDGGYDGGYSDPDYYDLEFRQQNPNVYGNDEYMQDYNGSGRSGRRDSGRTARRCNTRAEKDKQFHEEYLRWRRNHPEKIAFFREKSVYKPKGVNNNSSERVPLLISIIAALFIYPLIIMAIIDSCSN